MAAAQCCPCHSTIEVRHTGEYIGQCLKATCDEYGITASVTAVVHNGAANVKEMGNANGWQDIACAAHKLHFVVSLGWVLTKCQTQP